MKKNLLILIFIIVQGILYADNEFELSLNNYAMGKTSGNDYAHWIYSNSEGKFSKDREHIGIVLDGEGQNGKIEYGGRLILKDNGEVYKGDINRLYIGRRTKNFNMYIGKKEYEVSNKKSELSSGSLMVSNNASSPYRIYFGTNGYIPLPKTKERLLLSASISHSQLEHNRKCVAPYLHEKEGYLKLLVGEKSSVYGGITHIALWGGEVNGKKINSSFTDFLSVLLTYNIGKNDIETETENKIGDHKGIHEFGYTTEIGNSDINVYYQHFFEDRDGRKFQNWRDMLLGINVKNKKSSLIDEILFEYIYTKNQGGNSFHLDGGGQDYYYENYLYGPWSYKDMIIGNSLFVGSGSGKDFKIIHSRIKGFHIGLKGTLTEEYKYKILLSRTENCGTFADYNSSNSVFYKGKKQWYSLFMLNKENMFGNENGIGYISIGRDTGELSQNTTIMAGYLHKFRF